MSTSSLPRVDAAPSISPRPLSNIAQSRLSPQATLQPYPLPFGTTYRRGPASIASTTSYAPSTASTNETIAPLTAQRNAPSLRIKVDTNVAPSSHIWEEFYAESSDTAKLDTSSFTTLDIVETNVEDEGECDYSFQGVEHGDQTQSLSYAEPIHPHSQAINDGSNDAALSELLSLFGLPDSRDTASGATGTVDNMHQSAFHGFASGDYPGAEFLNLPDTASTAAFPQYPASDGFDLSQFDFTSIYAQAGSQTDKELDPVTIPVNRNTLAADSPLDPSVSSQHGTSPLDDSAPVAFDAPGIAKKRVIKGTEAKLLHQNSLEAANLSASSFDTNTKPTSASTFCHAGTKSHTQTHTAIDALLRVQENKTPSKRSIKSIHTGTGSPVPPVPLPNPILTASAIANLDRASSGQDLKRSLERDHPQLRRIRMRGLESDRSVIRFQKDVLRVAARFYTDLTGLFETTPSHVIKLGMSRSGLQLDDSTIPEVLDEIKSLVVRLTAKAAALPGYPSEAWESAVNKEETCKTHHQPRQGSATQPIDITAPTPRSDSARSPFATENNDAGNKQAQGDDQSPSDITPKAAMMPLPPCELTDMASPPSRKRKEIDPFTPESLGPMRSSATTAAASPDTTASYGAQATPMRTLRYPQPDTLHRSSQPSPGLIASSPYQAPMSNSPIHEPSRGSIPPLPPLPSPSGNRLIHGSWKPSEVERLRTLVAFSSDVEDGAPPDHVDWTWVVDNFGGTRNRHQVLIKAVEMGLRETSTHHSRRVKQKAYLESLEAMQSDLRDASLKPPTSPLPALLPSARINTSHLHYTTAESGSKGWLKSSQDLYPTGEGQNKRPRTMGDTPITPGKRDQSVYSDSAVSSPASSLTKVTGSSTRVGSVRTIPRVLDLSELSYERPATVPVSPKTSHTPSTPTTRPKVSAIAFKPYAHPSHAISATAPPRIYSRSCSSEWDKAIGMGLRSGIVALPGGREEDAGRPSVMSPTFGRFDASLNHSGRAGTGYQLAPIIDKGARDVLGTEN